MNGALRQNRFDVFSKVRDSDSRGINSVLVSPSRYDPAALLSKNSCKLYGTRRSVIESLGWLSTLFVLGAPRASPLTIVKHVKGLSAPTAIVQSRCLQNQRTSRRLRRHLRRDPRNR
jgi:hypothetical protein